MKDKITTLLIDVMLIYFTPTATTIINNYSYSYYYYYYTCIALP